MRRSQEPGHVYYLAYLDLASAYAWRGVLKLRPGLTARQLMEESTLSSSHPAFRREFQRILDGVRKAGLPEG